MTLVRARPKAHIKFRPSGPMADARKVALGMVLDWALAGAAVRAPAASVDIIEPMMAVHCAEKADYHSRLVKTAVTFDSIIDGKRAANEEIRWRTRGADPDAFEDIPWLELWALRDALTAAVTPRLVATMARWAALAR